MESASIGRRIGAATVDLLIFFVMHLLTIVVVIARLEVRNLAALVGVYAFWLFLYGAPEVFGAGTVGKRLLGLRVRDATGAEATRGQLGLRWVLKAAPILGFFGVGYVVALTKWNTRGGATVALIGTAMLSGLMFFAGAADFLFSLGPRRLALRDRVAKTAVEGAAGE
jgi:RDD family protein